MIQSNPQILVTSSARGRRFCSSSDPAIKLALNKNGGFRGRFLRRMAAVGAVFVLNSNLQQTNRVTEANEVLDVAQLEAERIGQTIGNGFRKLFGLRSPVKGQVISAENSAENSEVHNFQFPANQQVPDGVNRLRKAPKERPSLLKWAEMMCKNGETSGGMPSASDGELSAVLQSRKPPGERPDPDRMLSASEHQDALAKDPYIHMMKDRPSGPKRRKPLFKRAKTIKDRARELLSLLQTTKPPVERPDPDRMLSASEHQDSLANDEFILMVRNKLSAAARRKPGMKRRVERAPSSVYVSS